MAVLKSFLDGAFSSDLFTFKDNTFVCEASDLNNTSFMQQIYDDACDVGLAIRSTATGVVTKFHFDNLHRDADNDITHWTFRVTSDHVRDPALRKLKVTIFND